VRLGFARLAIGQAVLVGDAEWLRLKPKGFSDSQLINYKEASR
jgi:hypothetical protein